MKSRAPVLLFPRSILVLTMAVASCELGACGARAESPAGTVAATGVGGRQPAPAEIHASFDRLLSRYVSDGRVDYLTWRDTPDDAAALRRYLDALAEAEIDEWAEADRLAFYIDLYNATMIDTILDRVDATYSTADDEFGVFKEQLVRVAGKTVTLDHLENEIVRKRFDEPRIHVALVCGARSCPPILSAAYVGDTLDAVLEANMRSFVNSGERNRIGDESLELSKIFEWFADDFGGREAVGSYVDRYVEGRDVSRLPIEFLEYSWRLNLAAPSGLWKRVDRALPELAKDALVEVLAVDGDRTTIRKPGGGELSVPSEALAEHDFGL